ncbi:MAG: DeoR/GlpR transcriptional regulator [Lentisphaeria bacterium]|nr:DeoR/GlpR transcriptional regulator [Lentisphaeria bacterium]
MNSFERRNAILRTLADNKDVSIGALSKLLEYSTVTIRADLKILEQDGLVIRHHGKTSATLHKAIMDRKQYFTEEKNRIAKAAADMVNDGDRIMIAAGTTTSLITKYLFGKRDIHIVTNSTLVLPYARANPSMQITTIGGEFIASEEAYSGPLALHNLEQFYVDKAFIGTDGFSVDAGVTAKSLSIAEIGRKMVQQSRSCILVADSSKCDRFGFARIVPLNEINKLIIDKKLTASKANIIKELEIDLQLV